MSVKPMMASGIVQRTPEYGQIKHEQDSRPMVEQQNIGHMQQRQTERAAKQIIKKDNATDFKENRHDAREKTKGIFFDIRKQKNKETEEDDGKVIPKTNGHFDMRI